MDDRAKHLLAGLPAGARVIEIGPSFSLLAAKRDGWRTTVVDHEDRAGLLAKYRDNPQVDTSRIEEVDLVWRGGSLVDLVGRDSAGSYDAFVASHVIEHAPDVVRFLQAAQDLVSADGVVILALPDKRKCFDFFRPLSTTGDAVAAYREERSRHTAKTFFEHFMYQSHRGTAPGWSMEDRVPAQLDGRIESGPAVLSLAGADHYVDAHAWVFTPSSFELMVLELRSLGLLRLTIEWIEEAFHTEFFAWLRPGAEREQPDAVHARRLDLLKRMVGEQAEAAAQIV